MLIILFGFKMGDIRTHFLSDENSLEKEKERSRSSRKGKSQKTKFHKKAKGNGSKTHVEEELPC